MSNYLNQHWVRKGGKHVPKVAYKTIYDADAFLDEQLTVARLGQLRYWSLMEKVNKNQSDS